jgi:integrase
MVNDDEWLTMNQAAEISKYHPERIRELIREGKINLHMFGSLWAVHKGSLLLNRGVPSIVVSRRFGHANPSTTLNVYTHLYMESQDEPARIMDEILTLELVTLPQPLGVDNTVSYR